MANPDLAVAFTTVGAVLGLACWYISRRRYSKGLPNANITGALASVAAGAVLVGMIVGRYVPLIVLVSILEAGNLAVWRFAVKRERAHFAMMKRLQDVIDRVDHQEER